MRTIRPVVGNDFDFVTIGSGYILSQKAKPESGNPIVSRKLR